MIQLLVCVIHNYNQVEWPEAVPHMNLPCVRLLFRTFNASRCQTLVYSQHFIDFLHSIRISLQIHDVNFSSGNLLPRWINIVTTEL
jgi:hypothetical protein